MDKDKYIRTDFLDSIFAEYESRIERYTNKLEQEGKQIKPEDLTKEYLLFINSLRPYVNILEHNIIRRRILNDLKARHLI